MQRRHLLASALSLPLATGSARLLATGLENLNADPHVEIGLHLPMLRESV